MAVLARRPAAGIAPGRAGPPRRRAVRPACAAPRSLFDALDAMERSLDADIAALERDAASRGREAYAERVDAGPGFRSYSRAYSRVIVAGPRPTAPVTPSLITGPALGAALLVGAYAAVAARFARGFDATAFRRSRAPALIAGWPLLAALSGGFRKELGVALRAGGEGEGGRAAPAPPPPPDDADADADPVGRQ